MANEESYPTQRDSFREREYGEPERSNSTATILFGLFLILLGGLIFFDITDLVSISWTIIGSMMLILIGVALLLTARSGAHGGLVTLGIFISIALAIISVVSWPDVSATVGERTVVVDSMADLEDEYRWGIGEQVLDLRNLSPDGQDVHIDVQHGIGNLEVQLPPGTEYELTYHLGIGEVRLVDQSHSGFNLEDSFATEGFENATDRFVIEARLGIGQVEVR